MSILCAENVNINMSTSKRQARVESKKRKLEALLRISNNVDLTPYSRVDETAMDEKVSEEEPDSSQTDETMKKDLSAEELAKLRAELRLRQKAAMQLPKLYLTVEKRGPSSDRFVQCPDGLFVFDIQHLLLYALQGGTASYKPRWCKLLRHEKLSRIVVVIVEAVGATDFANFPKCFPFLVNRFPMNVEMVCPSQYGQTVASELFRVPVSVRRMKKMRCATVAGEKRPFETGAEVVVSEGPPAKTSRVDNVPESRVDLLLSREQMAGNGYPLPYSQSEKTRDYVLTKKTYEPVTEKSPLFAIDCEMCETESGRNELTRVAVVNEQRECVYETLVKPRHQITNYRTQYSGITRKMLKHVHTRIEEVQQRIQQLLPSDAILVGHSLNFDLDALQLMHPYIIDTSLCLNLSVNNGWKPSLKSLALRVLGKEIQTGGSAGHDPCEDALAALDVVLHRLQTYNENLPVDQDTGAVSEASVTASTDTYKPETASDKSSADEQHFEKSDLTERQTENVDVSSSMQCQSNATTVGAAFYCHPGTDCYESFGDVIKNAKKTVAMIGFGSEVHCTGDAVEHIIADCDRSVVRCCRDAVNRHFVTCARLSDIQKECQNHSCTGCASSCSACLQALFRKMNKRLQKLISSLESRTLAVILFAGGSRGDAEANQNAMCFVQVT